MAAPEQGSRQFDKRELYYRRLSERSTVASTKESYVQQLGGIDHLLNYAQQLGRRYLENQGQPSHRTTAQILTLGGSTAAAEQISAQRDINVIATGLTPPDSERLPDRVSYKQTYPETFDGILQSSIGGILSVGPLLSHAAEPRRVANAIHSVLIPGGVFKGALPTEITASVAGLSTCLLPQFQEYLNTLGFDTAQNRTNGVLIGIRPGGPSNIIAQELLQQDAASVSRNPGPRR